MRHLLGLAVRCVQSSTAQHRNTWILARVKAPQATPPGQTQRNPEELKELQRYFVVEEETKKKTPPLDIILLQDVEGVGHQFDIVRVERLLARSDLLPTRKAVYASPCDLKYYAEMRERMKDELAARVRIPYELLSTGRQLQQMVVPLRVNMDNPWTLDNQIIKSSLNQVGIDVVGKAIFLREGPSVSGPNFDLEAKLIRFYVVVNDCYVVPMTGRISHISAEESKQMLTPEKDGLPPDSELSKHGLVHESPYFNQNGSIGEDFDVAMFMKNRARTQS